MQENIVFRVVDIMHHFDRTITRVLYDPVRIKAMVHNKWGDKSIVYFASLGFTHFETWSPLNLEKGIGGSETAVIELSSRFARDGYEVTVYGEPGAGTGTYEGVEYRRWNTIDWADEFNIIIVWRAPYLIDNIKKAKRIFYDAHNVELNSNWKPERVKKITKAFFKSNYHRAMVPNIPDSKAAVISNGIQI